MSKRKFANDISGLGRLVVLIAETRSQILLRALVGGLGAAGGAVVEQPRPAEAGTAPTAESLVAQFLG